MTYKLKTFNQFINEKDTENIFYNDIKEFKETLKSELEIDEEMDKFSDELSKLMIHLTWEEVDYFLMDVLDNVNMDDWTESDMQDFTKRLNKEIKNVLRNNARYYWEEWAQNIDYDKQKNELKDQIDNWKRDMESDPGIELEGGKVADSYGEEIDRLTDELDNFESDYGFDGHKRQIEKQQKEIVNEILDLVKKEL